jgi:hypothetical protein
MAKKTLLMSYRCIVQNNDSLKIPQIKQMDKIYLNAAIAIVAADGDHANAGLTGFSPNSRSYRQNLEDIARLRFASTPMPFPKQVEHMKWFSQAWTYQEFMMSKRILLFTAEQVIYICKMGLICEGAANKAAQASPKESNLVPLLEPKGNFGQWLSTNRFLRHDWAHFVAFTQMVQSITARDVSNEADALRSVVGILEVLSESSNEKWICGMPSSYLEWALHWQPEGDLERRGRNYEGIEFPSWSWIGWKGRVKYPDVHKGTPAHLEPLIFDWRLFTASSVSRSGNLQFYLDNTGKTYPPAPTQWLPPQYAFDHWAGTDTAIEEAHQRQTNALLPLLEHGLLRFTARSAKFYVQTSRSVHPYMAEDIAHPVWRLIDPRTRQWVGTLHLGTRNDHLALAAASDAPLVEVELIAIANSRVSYELATRTLANGQTTQLPPYDVDAGRALKGEYKFAYVNPSLNSLPSL